MKILLDHCIAAGFGVLLTGYVVRTARSEGWDDLGNGRLLRAAAEAGFNVIVTVDRGIRHQQNAKALPLPVLLVLTRDARLEALKRHVPGVLAAIEAVRVDPQPRVIVVSEAGLLDAES